jgi:predicted transcriptional regulator
MERNTIITDMKIKWLADKGYAIKHNNNGNISYTITKEGKEYLNG